MINVFSKKCFLGIILLLTIILYLNAVFFNFVWDDFQLFLQSPYYNSDWSKICDAFIPGKVTEAVYTPVIFIIYFVLFKIFNNSPAPYHIFSLVTYLVVVYLFYQFVLLIFKKRIIALISALIFALHPLHVETVCWISCNSYGLCMIFFLLAFNIFAKLIQSNENLPGNVFLIILFHVLALFCQPTAVVFPVLILVYSFFFVKNNFKIAIKISIPCFVVTLIYIHLQTLGVKTSRFASEYAMSWQSKIVLLAKNIFNVFIPIEYMPQYPFPRVYTFSLIYLIIALIFLTIVIFIFVKRKCQIYNFFVIWFVISVFPYAHIVYPLSISTSDRYLYISSIASSILLGYIFYRYFIKFRRNSLRAKIYKFSPIILLVSFYFISAFTYSLVWANPNSLWLYAYKKNPGNNIVSTNYVLTLYNQQKYEEAIVILEKIMKQDDNSSNFNIYNLKIKILLAQQKYKEALETAILARSIMPSECGIYEVLAQIYFIVGDYKNSAKNLKFAIKFLDNISKYQIADRVKIYLETAMICYFAGETQEYLKYFDIWYEKQTEFKDQLISKGLECHKKGEYKNAGKFYYEFLEKQSSDSVHIRRLYEISKLQEYYAIEEADDILSNSVENYMKVNELLQKGEKRQAQDLLEKAMQINSFSFDVYYILGQIALQENNITQAKKYLKKAYELNPSAKEILQFAK